MFLNWKNLKEHNKSRGEGEDEGKNLAHRSRDLVPRRLLAPVRSPSPSRCMNKEGDCCLVLILSSLTCCDQRKCRSPSPVSCLIPLPFPCDDEASEVALMPGCLGRHQKGAHSFLSIIIPFSPHRPASLCSAACFCRSGSWTTSSNFAPRAPWPAFASAEPPSVWRLLLLLLLMMMMLLGVCRPRARTPDLGTEVQATAASAALPAVRK